jgi:SsrA-binding protein
MAKKTSKSDDPNTKMISRNRRARHEYEILDQLECGIVLRGSEVKSLRDGKVSLEEAYARIVGEELWLLGCDIAEYPQANLMNHEPRRDRKLLVHRRELKKFAAAAEQRGMTMIPLSIYFTEGKVKVEIAVGKGRQLHDKREKLKQASDQMEMKRAMSNRRVKGEE